MQNYHSGLVTESVYVLAEEAKLFLVSVRFKKILVNTVTVDGGTSICDVMYKIVELI